MMNLPSIHFFTTENMGQMWQYIGVIFLLGAPLLVIIIATDLGGYLLSVIREVFSFRKQRDEFEYDDRN